jgi:hypothetical protein
MGLKTTIIGLLLVGQLSCSDENVDISSFNDDSSISTLNGNWKVYSFENFSTMTVEYATQENSWDKYITVTFDDTKDPNELAGTNITNTILGEFEYVAQRQFKMNTLSTTQVGQPEWADEFTNAILDNEASFEINTEQLRIYYDNKTKSVTLNRLTRR